jgi:DNA-directed RNA polymerase subunit RPC12/RpoP
MGLNYTWCLYRCERCGNVMALHLYDPIAQRGKDRCARCSPTLLVDFVLVRAGFPSQDEQCWVQIRRRRVQ